jgi:hypothetical protein
MRRLPALLLTMLAVGCAPTPQLTLRIDAARTARLAPEVVRQLEARDEATLREIDRDLERDRQRVATARQALAAAKAEPVIPDAADVHVGQGEARRLRAEVGGVGTPLRRVASRGLGGGRRARQGRDALARG